MTNTSTPPHLNWRDSFQVKSFRYQWPADLATSWAFEMETILLGWYILSTSGSVLMLVVYGSLQYLGSLLSPVFGVVCDRMGYRRMLWSTRAIYALLAFGIMLLSYFEALTPERVLILAAIVGIIRPSDQMMRNALIARTLPAAQLMGALGISRMTSESARIAGALAGAGIVAVLGMTSAYAVVTLLYVISFWLSRGVDDVQPSPNATALASPLQDLKSAFTYVWHKPILMGAMAVAFLVNLLAFPFALGLLPYAAKNIFLTNQTGLGFLGASFAFGGLLASLTLSSHKFKLRASQTMIIASVAWFALDLVFAFTSNLYMGMLVLMLAGFVQSLCMTPLAAVMLRATDPAFHGRVMGMRMLAIWGLPIGLLASGPLVENIGYVATAWVYSALGLILTLAIALYWRNALWDKHSVANNAL
ncbi:MAG: MFS transporter [Burkholderiales bacterium]